MPGIVETFILEGRKEAWVPFDTTTEDVCRGVFRGCSELWAGCCYCRDCPTFNGCNVFGADSKCIKFFLSDIAPFIANWFFGRIAMDYIIKEDAK